MLIVFELYINCSVIQVAGDEKSDTIPIQFAQYLPDIPFDGPIIKFINSILNNERRKVKRYYLMFPSSPWLSPAASASAAHVPSPKYPSSPGAAWHPPGLITRPAAKAAALAAGLTVCYTDISYLIIWHDIDQISSRF